jgi:hypothetical protein
METMIDKKTTTHLFVYGSLREPSIFESVCGFSFTLKPSESTPWNVLAAELAMLPNYRRFPTRPRESRGL